MPAELRRTISAASSSATSLLLCASGQWPKEIAFGLPFIGEELFGTEAAAPWLGVLAEDDVPHREGGDRRKWIADSHEEAATTPRRWRCWSHCKCARQKIAPTACAKWTPLAAAATSKTVMPAICAICCYVTL